jgi:hypothetical protein
MASAINYDCSEKIGRVEKILVLVSVQIFPNSRLELKRHFYTCLLSAYVRETDQVSETLVFNSPLTRQINWEDFNARNHLFDTHVGVSVMKKQLCFSSDGALVIV